MAWTLDLKTCCCKVSSLRDGEKIAELQFVRTFFF